MPTAIPDDLPPQMCPHEFEKREEPGKPLSWKAEGSDAPAPEDRPDFRTAPIIVCNHVRAFSKNAFFENFANFWRARSRLYQNEILQENMRSTAFFKLYKICILLHRCNLKIFAKNRFEKSAIFVKFQQRFCIPLHLCNLKILAKNRLEKSAIFVKIQQKFCKCRKICKILPNFKNFSLIIW